MPILRSIQDVAYKCGDFQKASRIFLRELSLSINSFDDTKKLPYLPVNLGPIPVINENGDLDETNNPGKKLSRNLKRRALSIIQLIRRSKIKGFKEDSETSILLIYLPAALINFWRKSFLYKLHCPSIFTYVRYDSKLADIF